MELPLVDGTHAEIQRKLEAPNSGLIEKPRSTASRTLLCIEDNLSNLRLVERILSRRPEVKLISVQQNRLGLQLERQNLPDCVVLDLHLPDMQGEEILRQLRADPRTAQLPVVMISADATSSQIEHLAPPEPPNISPSQSTCANSSPSSMPSKRAPLQPQRCRALPSCREGSGAVASSRAS